MNVPREANRAEAKKRRRLSIELFEILGPPAVKTEPKKNFFRLRAEAEPFRRVGAQDDLGDEARPRLSSGRRETAVPDIRHESERLSPNIALRASRRHDRARGPFARAWRYGDLNECGWGTWIRTKINGVRVRCSTVELSPNGPRGEAARRADLKRGLAPVNMIAAVRPPIAAFFPNVRAHAGKTRALAFAPALLHFRRSAMRVVVRETETGGAAARME